MILTIASDTWVDAPAETVWDHITQVDIASFRHPPLFSLLGIPKPLRAETTEFGVGGTRTAFFSQDRRFEQKITRWEPFQHFAFTFQASPNFRVGYLLDLAGGPFRMTAGAYRLTPERGGVGLRLSSEYVLDGPVGVLLFVPVRIVLILFQRYLLRGIKANAERDAAAAAGGVTRA